MSIVRSEKSATPLCQTMHERFFVEALLLHCRQKWKEAPGALIKMTHDQLKEIIVDRHEVELDPTQFQRLKRKYVTLFPVAPNGEVRVASRYELLREVVKGRIGGVPSEYEATGLRSHIDPVADRSEGPSCFSS